MISKVIANRLKPLLPFLISEEQIGYVERRQILNNIIQGHEVVHSLKHSKKAVTLTNFSILLNGAPSNTFTPSRGLRQGDPLSPFLFVLMMEGLGRALKMANAEGRIQGIKLTPDGEANTHQQFVADMMLQGVPIVREGKATKDILNDFIMALGIEGIKQQIRNIPRNFIWGRGEKKNKWSLVAWDKLCTPKSHGGLGMEDLETLNQASGAKLWWRWIKDSRARWVKLWTQKYAKH
eukprot:PITA_20633